MSEHIETKKIKCWCAIGDARGRSNLPYEYDPRSCFNSIIDYTKYILTQVIYMDYLVESSGKYSNGLHTPVIDQLIVTLRDAIIELPSPKNIVQTDNLHPDLLGLYTRYYHLLTVDRYKHQDIVDLLLAPNLDEQSPIVNIEELKSFLIPYIHTSCRGINVSQYCNMDGDGNQFFTNPIVLIPSHTVYANYTITLNLSPVTLSTVYFTSHRSLEYMGILGMLANMDLSLYTADDLIALYCGTTLSEDSLLMNPEVKHRIRILTYFLFDMCKNNKLKVDVHQPLFAKCMNMAGVSAPTDIALEMLTLDTSKWTKQHLQALKCSPLYSNLGTSLVMAMEAATDDTDFTDDAESTSMGVDDPMGDTDINTEDEETDDRLDTVMQLLELAKSDEKFSDHMYRKLLTERMINVVKNPPHHMSKAQISLLKSWLTYWINLVSIASLKSFLTKFQFDFMGIKTYKLVNNTK